MSYDYGECGGPHTWVLNFPAASGKRQSPINLNTSAMEFDKSLRPLQIDLEGITTYSLTTKDHNFQISVQGRGILEGGPLFSKYKLMQFHFHWGTRNTWGSEHLVNGVSSPSELHCVFMNTAYETPEKAMQMPDGLAVVGIFLHIGNQANRSLEELCWTLGSMKVGETRILDSGFSLASLLPRDMSKYYTYPGSLTTPPCSECVTWIVMDEIVTITKDQINKFRQSHSKCIVCGCTDNFRPVCPAGSRPVRCSFQS
ncbi:unnamed protein product [Calicophoron daubneyi]|uniref:carbonic anhydrase n=1 Tax=Calicophoron daubneyi TaxID=300641 RepID=A0AAV2TC82_CALDB